MHKDVINAALAIATIVRFLDADSRIIFAKYIDFVGKKAVAGELKTDDDYVTVMDEFIETVLNDEN